MFTMRGRKKTRIKNVKPHFQVCSRHFNREDYQCPGKCCKQLFQTFCIASDVFFSEKRIE